MVVQLLNDVQLKSVLGSTCPIASIGVKNKTTAFVQFGQASDAPEANDVSPAHPISLIRIQSYCDQVKVSASHRLLQIAVLSSDC